MDPQLLDLINEAHPDTRPGTLYHYTTQIGLMGIFRTRSIWASNIHYLNDAMEYRQTLELAKSVLTNKLKEHWSHALTTVPMTMRLGALTGQSVFVTSFSEHRDQLSQWRGYCGDSLGFSVGFVSAQLEAVAKRNGFALLPCIYEKKRQIWLIEKIFELAMAKVGKTEHPIEPINWFVLTIGKIAPILKNDSFKEEAEWRLIPIRDPYSEQVEFRDGGTMMIPYVQVGLVDEAMQEDESDRQRGERISEELTQLFNWIVVGPNPHMDLALKSVEQFVLWKHHVRVIHFMPSTIPYRAW